eukprot:m.139096 g.139096  ORF g.139096 m.139096 type:complete len:568 (-) comp14790_c1_seq4:1154-2857(-)
MPCIVCGSESLSQNESGFFVCDDCGVQSQDFIQEGAEITDAFSHRRREKEKRVKKKVETQEIYKGTELKQAYLILFQKVLQKQALALISLGLDSILKEFIKRIWLRYVLQVQDNQFPQLSESIAICYIAIRLCRQPMLTCDLLRLVLQGKLPFYLAYKDFPQEIRERIPASVLQHLKPTYNLSMVVIEKSTLQICKLLSLLPLPPIPHSVVMAKCCTEPTLNIPEAVCIFGSNLLRLCPPPYEVEILRNTDNAGLIGAVVSAYILVAAKMLYGMDGKRECRDLGAAEARHLTNPVKATAHFVGTYSNPTISATWRNLKMPNLNDWLRQHLEDETTFNLHKSVLEPVGDWRKLKKFRELTKVFGDNNPDSRTMPEPKRFKSSENELDPKAREDHSTSEETGTSRPFQFWNSTQPSKLHCVPRIGILSAPIGSDYLTEAILAAEHSENNFPESYQVLLARCCHHFKVQKSMVAKQVGKLELEMETWVNERNRPKHSRIQEKIPCRTCFHTFYHKDQHKKHVNQKHNLKKRGKHRKPQSLPQPQSQSQPKPQPPSPPGSPPSSPLLFSQS